MANPLGSNGYVEEFLQANRPDLGGGDYKDLMAVMDAVIARGRRRSSSPDWTLPKTPSANR